MIKLRRYKYKPNHYKFLTFNRAKKNIKIKFSALKKKYKVSSVIKFQSLDFRLLKKKFYHFNIGNSNHKKNKLYLILKIYKKGFYKNNVEVLPIYSLKKVYIFKSFFVKENIKINKIKKKFLYNSLNTTNTQNKLLNSLKRRYRYLFNRGKINVDSIVVSITGLKLYKKINLI